MPIKKAKEVSKKEKVRRHLFPKRIYGRKVRTSRRKVRRIVNPSGMSVFRKAIPTRKKSDERNGMQSASDWVIG